MRIAINVQQDGSPSLIEEDVEFALAKWIGATDFEILEQSDGCFTADTEETLTPDETAADRIAAIIKRDAGAIVSVEFIDGWPPEGWSP